MSVKLNWTSSQTVNRILMEERERTTGKEFISGLEKYKSAIEDKSHISRKTFIWSLISLFFVCGGLTLNQESLLIKQMPFKGITETMFLVFLLIVVSCWLIRLTFLYNKTYTFLKIKEIGCIKLISYIYSYPVFSKPLSELSKTNGNMPFADYEIRREIYDEARNAKPEHPNDIQIDLRDPVTFFLEYFVVPAVIFFLALFAIISLAYKIVT